MKPMLDSKGLQRVIIRSIGVMILALIVVLVVIPGIENSQFSQLKKYDQDRDLGEALKRKQHIADSRYYQTEGFVESHSSHIYRIGDFNTNIRSQGKQKLILNLSVQYDNNKVPGELKSKNPIIRNRVISIASDAQYLHSVSGKNLLKKNLTKGLNEVVSEGEITEVYFNKFLIQ